MARMLHNPVESLGNVTKAKVPHYQNATTKVGKLLNVGGRWDSLEALRRALEA